MSKYAVVLGYGLFNNRNRAYKKYLDTVTKFINEKGVRSVVLCGGHTDPSLPSRSEAGTMADYLTHKLTPSVRILLEDKSLTSGQNIEFSKKLIDLKKDNSVTVFCDNIRPPKIMWLILHYWFNLRKNQIEQYFIDYFMRYYSKHYTTERIGEEINKGLEYENILIKPVRMHDKIENAIGNQISMLMEVESLYDKALCKKLMNSVKTKFGFQNS